MTDLHALLEATFPIESRYFTLAWVPEEQALADLAPEADLYVLLRLFSWRDGEEDGQRYVRDIKEQPVLLVPARSRQDPRLEAWLQGTREALLAVMSSQDPWAGEHATRAPPGYTPLDYMLPFGLVHPDALQLARARTAEDFTDALLRSKRRLGGLLFPPPAPPARG